MRRISGIISLSSFAVLVTLLAAPAIGRAQDLYRVRMSAPGAMGMVTDCSSEGYVLAHPESGGKMLHSTGSELDGDGSLGPDLFLDLVTDVAWSRTFDVGRGLAGTFNGCYGETNTYSGNLFIFLETNKGQKTVRFIWHFDYYNPPGSATVEHFTLKSGKIPFPALTEGIASGRVAGTFDIERYYKDPDNRPKSVSLTGGVGRPFEFDLVIEKVPPAVP